MGPRRRSRFLGIHSTPAAKDIMHTDCFFQPVYYSREQPQKSENIYSYFYPPSQKATGVNPWMNAKRVTLRGLGEGGYASAGFTRTENENSRRQYAFI